MHSISNIESYLVNKCGLDSDTTKVLNILTLHLAKSRNINSRELHEFQEFETFCEQRNLTFIPLEDSKVNLT